MASALLGEDGRGYDLARRLDGCGAWRAWLGDAAYAHFSHAISSPAAWDFFLSPRAGAGAGSVHATPGRTQIELQLQLRARALLYDKASAALFLSHSHSINDINPNFLQLHGDDVYFSLDEEKEDGNQFQPQSAFNVRHSESDNPAKWPSSWYKQYAEKFRIRHHKLPVGDKEIPKRTPEGMLTYLKLSTVHKRKRQVFKDYNSPGDPISLSDETLFPEFYFPSDCVPDSALPKASLTQKRAKMEFHAVLDNLPGLVNRSPAMIERFGIMLEYYKVGNKYRGNGGEGKHLTEEQGNAIVRKSVVRFMATAGYENTTAGALDVLSEVVSRHVCKLGRSLKILTDGYRKQFSAVDLLKMFLQASGCSIGALSEITKGGNKAGPHQMQQQHSYPLQSQHQNNLLHVQQRQFSHPQMNLVHSQSLAFQHLQQQQQLQQLRRSSSNPNQINSPRGSVMMADSKVHHPLADVKIENTIDAQMDAQSGFGSAFNQRQQQLQQMRLQQQQQMMMGGNNLVQSNNSNNSLIHPGMQQQFKPMQSAQISQLQAQNMYGMRAAPVKVEAFHELVSGGNEHNKLPPTK
ncbi:hypothetical protein LUZ63_000444 [Rhynchospora breviuscula]|uniref:Bromodomain associated domain-containing protein n=1 Tax=Rhynchospora breviuscula TaxID=2022672 RepID=A0A9Q0HWN1_9POAL|nr:hypothetical protein LUZ63_000444 [Rhynchospora breviuscula]